MTKHAKQNVEYTLSTFAIEGLKPSQEAIKLYGKMSDHELSLSDILKAIEVHHGITGAVHA